MLDRLYIYIFFSQCSALLVLDIIYIAFMNMDHKTSHKGQFIKIEI